MPMVLVVEDDATVAEMVCRMLAYGGFQVESVRSGKEALAHAGVRRGAVDLFVIDASLPRMSGISLAQQLPTRTPRAPIVFMSGHPNISDPGSAIECLFLRKPFSADELLDAVEKLLRFPKSQNA